MAGPDPAIPTGTIPTGTVRTGTHAGREHTTVTASPPRAPGGGTA